MPRSEVAQFLRRFRRQPGLVGLPDERLLDRFVSQRDESAFAALLARHGPMVLGVCRRVLHDAHRAEDVFQATFLTLACNATSIRKRPSVGSWLHGVALRLARKARAQAASPAPRVALPGTTLQPDPLAEASWREVRQILDEELQRLPECYRLPLVLCYLEGRTRDEAAAELGWTTGRLKGLLERGRARLRGRLIRRGLTPAAAGTALMAETALAMPVPSLLAVTTLRVALRRVADEGLRACGVSGLVISLTEGGLILGSKKHLLVLAVVLGLGMLGTGAGWLARWPGYSALAGSDQEPVAGTPPAREAQKTAALGQAEPANDKPVPAGKPKGDQVAVRRETDRTVTKPVDPVRKYEIVADATQPVGSPILLKLIMTNTGKERLDYMIAGPGRYPAVDLVARVTDAAGKTRALRLSNGQTLGGISGLVMSVEPGDSVTIPAAIPPLPGGNYLIEVGGSGARVTARDDAELLKQREDDLLARIHRGEPFARHVVATCPTPSLRAMLLRDLCSTDFAIVRQAGLTLDTVEKLPADALPLLTRAMDTELARDQPRVGVRQAQSRDLLDLVARLMARIGSDEALDLVLKLARSESGRASGVRVLGTFRQERAVQELRGFLKSTDEGLRGLAAFALAERHDPAAVEVLVAIATNNRNSWRGIACQALAKFPDDPRAEPAIRSNLDDREAGNEARAALRQLQAAQTRKQP